MRSACTKNRRFPRLVRGAFVALAFTLASSAEGGPTTAPSDSAASQDYDEAGLEAFADAAALWGGGVEAVIEEAYRECFRTYIVDGRILTLRMPFGQNNERSELADSELAIQGGGKANPSSLWTEIDAILASQDFRSFAAALSDGREKIVIFDLATRSWSTNRDLFHLARMKAGAYLGLPHRPYVLSRGQGVSESDLYNYLYCVGRLGMDCSGFVWHVLTKVAARGDLDLGAALKRSIGAPRSANSSLYIGTWFFDPKNRELETVKDEIRKLRPGDVIIFRGDDGTVVHSSVIQSIDRDEGRIRYLQSTDEAPRDDRGVHESFILFDPEKPETSLKDPSLEWSQRRLSPFEGEKPSTFRDDGERYRAYPEHGGGTVVRLKALAKPIAKIAKSAQKK